MSAPKDENGLTARQEGFVQSVLQGKSLSDAYRENYNCAKWKPETVWEASSRLMSDSKVAARLSSLKAKATELVLQKTALTKEWVLNGLIETIAEARQAVPVLDSRGEPTGEYKQNLAAAVRGYELLGKELAMFVDRKEIRTGPLDGLSKDELAERAAEIANRIGIQPNAQTRRH
jgi:hypothetical protein